MDSIIQKESERRMAAAREFVQRIYMEKFGRVRWWFMSANEKENYAMFYCLGFMDGEDAEHERQAEIRRRG